MKQSLLENIQNRRSYYNIGRSPKLTDEQLIERIQQAVLHTPSAFNSQTTRVVVLLKDQHEALWEIVKNTLKAVVPQESFAQTEKKIASFSAGYGTVLFFEDFAPLEALKPVAGLYADKFSDWSNHTSGMHQINIWMLLEDAGYGASLQHYNTLIDDEVKKKWNIPMDWKLVAQMPFGSIEGDPQPKEFKPLEDRFWVYGAGEKE